VNLVTILREHARTRPDAPAILDPRPGSWGRGRTRVTTFADLDRLSSQAATLLLRKGLKPGDAVLVLHPMSAELYVALVAVFRLGMVVTALDPSAGLEHIERSCAIHPPRALIASSKAHLLRLVSPALRRIPVKFAIGWPVPGATRWALLNRFQPHADVVPVEPDAPALLTFTSGSTGRPKGAVRTHGFLRAQHLALEHDLGLKPGDVDVATLPIVLLANLGSGVTSLVPDADLRRPGFIDPGPVVRQIQEHRATSSVASPAFFERLARYCRAHSVTLPSLRKLFTGGAPVFPRLLDQLQEMAPNADVVALYGSTEAEPIARLSRRQISADDDAAMLAGRGLLAGRPVPEVTLRILRDRWGTPVSPLTPHEFDAECAATGEPGEIVVTGGHVLKGYMNGVGDEETKFRVGDTVWHRTGDAGYLDAGGRLWLLGRCVGRIDDARGRLYPFAAETAAYQDERVKRAAAVAHAGRRVLVLEWHDPAQPGDADAIRRALAWAAIDEVRVWPHIPVDSRHNAKIDYPALRKMLDAGA
jgi:acyl-CoA synthetase (AMP-forming)/AMP-acid ligase II